MKFESERLGSAASHVLLSAQRYEGDVDQYFDEMKLFSQHGRRQLAFEALVRGRDMFVLGDISLEEILLENPGSFVASGRSSTVTRSAPGMLEKYHAVLSWEQKKRDSWLEEAIQIDSALSEVFSDIYVPHTFREGPSRFNFCDPSAVMSDQLEVTTVIGDVFDILDPRITAEDIRPSGLAEDLRNLSAGLFELETELGITPDLHGPGNILVATINDHARLRLIDCGVFNLGGQSAFDSVRTLDEQWSNHHLEVRDSITNLVS